MSSTTTLPPKEPRITKKKVAKVAKVAKPKTPSSHPPYNEMVLAAMAKLTNRKGVSLKAITKFVDENYKLDAKLSGNQIKTSLKRLLEKDLLCKHKGIGAAGSFKLSTKSLEDAAKKKKKPDSKTAAKKPASPKKAKPATAPTKKLSPKKSPAKTKPKAKPKDAKKPKKTTKAATKPAAKTKKPAAKKPKTPKKPATKKK